MEDDAPHALVFRAALHAHNKAHGVEATRRVLDALFAPPRPVATTTSLPLFSAPAFRGRWADIADDDDS
jgi:hypothetical protein